ncbi:MAG TPA: GIDE domain-containing protein [Candidatus Edwardsbacteria bacterium]|nr:GIDE domain-containing protein [Candidatus Edwardsbacteria bacterium]
MHIFTRIQLAARRNRQAAGLIAGAVIVVAYLFVMFFPVGMQSLALTAPSGTMPALGYAGALLVMALGVLVLTYSFAVWKEKRLIEDIPTSKARSLAMGLVEVQGLARPKLLLKSPVTMTDCVYYRYKIEKYVRSGRSSHWSVIDEGASTNYFYVEDDTGRVLADPVDADVRIKRDYQWTGDKPGTGWLGIGSDKMRYSEWWLAEGDPVYAIGTVTRWKDARDDRRFKIAEKLRLLKADAARMKEFDRDGDGQISADEWELARARIEQDVLKEELDHPVDTSDDFVITRDKTNEVMIISDQSEKQLARSFGWQAAGFFILGLGLILWMAYLLLK